MLGYQLAIHADVGTRDALERGLLEKAKRLRVEEEDLSFLPSPADVDCGNPAVVVIAPGDPALEARAHQLATQGVYVVPLLIGGKAAPASSPLAKLLHHAPEEIDELCELCLVALGIVGRERSAFISYAWIDGEIAARALFEELSVHGYRVFLDRSDVRAGQELSPALHVGIANSEVVVFLESAGFQASKWCKDEMQKACEIGVPGIAVVWPGLIPANPDMLELEMLATPVFDAVRVGRRVRSLRPEAVAANRSRGLGEVAKAAAAQGTLESVAPAHVDLTDGTRVFQSFGAPRPDDLYVAHSAAQRAARRHLVLYDDEGVANQDYASWLARYLPVSLCPCTEIEWRMRGGRP